MPKYIALLSKMAQKQLDKLPDNIAAPILDSIGHLEEDSRPQGYKKLRGRAGYRVRTGNYRIIYDIFDNKLIIEIIALGHRKNIYE
ncbi:MAG: type II toxin-antitoxin system RelE/ParE family toxin [Sphingobacteriales bacterium]